MSKGKILVVDDSPLVRKLAEVSLQESGYEVFTADNGEDGLKIAEKELPDLILVDFIMPKMTGSQFCLMLKENEKLKDIPIILITGKGEAVGQAFIEKYGVMDYFTKPFKSEDLIEKIESILGKVKPEEKVEEFTRESFIEEQIPEIVEEEMKLTPEEEIVLPEEAQGIIKFTSEETPLQISEEEPIEFPPLEEIEEIAEIKPEEFSKEQEEISVPEREEEIEIPHEPLLEEKKEEIMSIPEEILSASKEEEVKFPLEELHVQEPYLLKEELSEIKLEAIEKIIEDKLQDFYSKINNSLSMALEGAFKKFGIIPEDRIILKGKSFKFDGKVLLEFIVNSKLTGFFNLFSNDLIFEFLFIEGEIVYGIASSLKLELGNKFLKDFTSEEIKKFTIQSLNLLMKTKIDNFILEDRVKSETYLDTLPRYDINELIKEFD